MMPFWCYYAGFDQLSEKKTIPHLYILVLQVKRPQPELDPATQDLDTVPGEITAPTKTKSVSTMKYILFEHFSCKFV